MDMDIKDYEGTAVEAAREYLLDLRLRNCSPRTITEYQKVLGWYFRDAGCCELADTSKRAVREWVASMWEKGLAPGTIATRVGVLKRVFQGAGRDDLANCLPKVKAGSRLPQALTKEEVAAFFEQIKASGTRRSRRDYVLFMLMYSCGLRVSEAVSLRVEDVDLDAGAVLVHGKGNKERQAYLRPGASATVREWVGDRTTGWLFPGANGAHLSARVIQHYAKQYGRAVGLDNVHPHSFRHSCATHYLLGGAPITFVQALLGHTKLSATGLYTQLSNVERQRIANSTELAI